MAAINSVRQLPQLAGAGGKRGEPGALDAQTVGEAQGGVPLSGPAVAGGTPFAEQLSSLLSDVNGLQQQASSLAEGLARGTVTDLHQVMLAQEEASVAFKLVAEMRNKLVQAYQEVLRMPV